MKRKKMSEKAEPSRAYKLARILMRMPMRDALPMLVTHG